MRPRENGQGEPGEPGGLGGPGGLANPSRRFFGVQWRFLYSHVEVAVGAAVVTALLVGIPLLRGYGLLTAGLSALLALILSILGGAWLALDAARGVKLRLRETSRFASALARGDYRWRIVLPPADSAGRTDEIDQLAAELNFMADSLEGAIAELRALAERNRSLAEETGRLAALEERTRLARDLHDTVNQQVFALSMQAASARRRLEAADSNPAQVGEVAALLDEVEGLARSAHRQMRDLILQLRPTTLEQQGLAPALEEYVRTFTEGQGLDCVCRIECSGSFGLAVEEALFRITQEALNNVAKHSKAKKVEVALTLDASRHVVLTVTDDGRGFDQSVPARATALGLRGLRERAAALGGRVKVTSAPGQGTKVEAAFPMAREGQEPAAASPAQPEGDGTGTAKDSPVGG